MPQCIGTIHFAFTCFAAHAASRGPIVKWSPIGRIAISGAYSSPTTAMSIVGPVSPA